MEAGDADGGWQMAKAGGGSKKARARYQRRAAVRTGGEQGKPTTTLPITSQAKHAEATPEHVAQCLAALEDARARMRGTELVQEARTQLQATPSMGTGASESAPYSLVVLGIGQFAASERALFQLAFILETVADMPHVGTTWSMFDPCMSPLEVHVAGQVGFRIRESNECGAIAAEGPTIFYLPHCTRLLHHNVLWANWTPSQLLSSVLLCNSFAAYDLRIIDSEARAKSHIIKSLPVVKETMLPAYAEDETIFNDLAVHTFLAADKPSDDAFWSRLAQDDDGMPDAELATE